MPRDARAHLTSMLDSCDYVLHEAAAIDSEAFLKNETLRRAFRYSFATIGESMSQLRQQYPDVYALFDVGHKVVDFRHLLIHHYWDTDDLEVWSIAKHSLPPLRERIFTVLHDPRFGN